MAMTRSNKKGQMIVTAGAVKLQLIKWSKKSSEASTCDIGEVQVEAVFLISPLVLRHLKENNKSETSSKRNICSPAGPRSLQPPSYHPPGDLLQLFLLSGQSENPHQDYYPQEAEKCHHPRGLKRRETGHWARSKSLFSWYGDVKQW